MMHRLLPLVLTAALASLHGVCDAFVTNHHNAATRSSKLQSQILDFIEPSTGVQVKLIGAMYGIVSEYMFIGNYLRALLKKNTRQTQ
mmetsp:Transcript_13637/g.19418  ORF Transcript_13637/g.19418 Transcript_13637/m.19418 type:complete len:87 (+) Transcript_13637:86-346(+)